MNYIYKSLLIKISTLYLLHFIAFPSKKKNNHNAHDTLNQIHIRLLLIFWV